METLVAGDIQYLSYYLRNVNKINGSITYQDLTNSDTITFRLRKFGETVNAIDVVASIVDSTIGYTRALVTIPTVSEGADYYSEVEVKFTDGQILTWIGNTYYIKPQLG